jgi:MFS family permease
VSRTHPDKGLDYAIGIQSGSGNVGVFVAFISVGTIAQRFSWQTPLYVWAAAALGAGALSFAIVRSRNSLHKGLVKPRIKTWLDTARSLKRLLPGFVFGGACWGVTVYYAPSLLNHRFQVPLGTTGIFLASWIVMPYLFGYLSRTIGRDRLALVGLSGSALVVGLLGLAGQRELAVSALLVYGGFLFLIYPAFQSYVGSQVPLPDQAVAFSVVANVQMLSGALVNLLSGFLSDRFGIHSPFLFLAAMGIGITGYFIRNREVLEAPKIRDPAA